jgi:hypothetical protein
LLDAMLWTDYWKHCETRTVTRAAAAVALGEIGAVEAVADLTVALSDQEQSVRLQAARALGRIGSSQTADCLRLLARVDPESVGGSSINWLTGSRPSPSEWILLV